MQREMTEEGNCRLMAPLIFFRKKQQKIPGTEVPGNLLEVTTRFELVDEGFADPCLTTWPRHHIGVNISTPFGAADEARTRYLHLGKVALYQMSYGRIFGAFDLAPVISDALKTSFKVGESSRFLGGDPDRARTDDPQRDRLVL